MKIMNLKDEIRDMRMDPPGGYGAFEEDQLYERTEDVKDSDKDECDICGSQVDDHGYFTCQCYSPCCGARMIDDCDLCPDCHEHI
jgi:hypothetical protein